MSRLNYAKERDRRASCQSDNISFHDTISIRLTPGKKGNRYECPGNHS